MVNKQRRYFKDFLIIDSKDSPIRPCDIFSLCSHAADHHFKPTSAAHFLEAFHVYLLLKIVVLSPPVKKVKPDSLYHSFEGIAFAHATAETEISAYYMKVGVAFGASEGMGAV